MKVLDHHPATELLSDGATVTGAAGLVRATGEDWRIDAGATVLATGGCAFFERILGGTGLTGDGLLMAAEAGASLSGMEFTGKYTLAPLRHLAQQGPAVPLGDLLRRGRQAAARRQGRAGGRTASARPRRTSRAALIAGPGLRPARPGRRASAGLAAQGQPNCFLPYDRLGDRPVPRPLPGHAARRGHGARHRRHPHHQLRMHDRGPRALRRRRRRDPRERRGRDLRRRLGQLRPGRCRAAGGPARAPPATPAAAARRRPSAPSRAALGTAGLRPTEPPRAIDPREVVAAVRDEVIPLDRTTSATARSLPQAATGSDALWRDLRAHLAGEGTGRLRAREVASVTAAARWSVAAALARTESRGMHRRTDLPGRDDALAVSLLVSGLDEVTVRAGRRPAEREERAS